MSNNEKMKLKYVQTPGIQKVLDHASQSLITTDGLSNVVAGLGGASDKRSYNRWTHQGDPFNNFGELEALYRSSWIARQIVDIPANDATREWRTFEGEAAQKIEAVEKKLNVKSRSNDWIKNARLYGGGLMLMVTGQDLSKPLNLDRVREGDLKKVLVFDRWYLSGTALNVTDPLSDNFLESEYYFLAGTGQAIHHSHICRLNGAFLPMRLNHYEQGFGDSVLRKCQQDISDVSSTSANIANLIFQANVDTIKRKGLFAALASGDDQKLINRYQKLNMLKSAVNLTLLDDDESYERNQLAFSGLPQIQQMQMQWISGAADIPMTRMFGSSPGGLNATGESDLNNYYDSVKSEQEGQYREGLEKLDQVMLRSAGVDPETPFEWNPLYQDSNTERATQKLATAQTDQVYLDYGVITEAQVAKRLQSDGDYDIEDSDIKDLEDIRNDERESMQQELDDLRAQQAANEESIEQERERANRAVADASIQAISIRKNFDENREKLVNQMQEMVSSHTAEIEQLNSEFEVKISDAAISHRKEMEEKVQALIDKQQAETQSKQVSYDAMLEQLKVEHTDQITEMRATYDQKVSEIENQLSEEIQSHDNAIKEAEAAAETKVQEAQLECDRLVKDAEASAKEAIEKLNNEQEGSAQFADSINDLLEQQKLSFEEQLETVKREAKEEIKKFKDENDIQLAEHVAKSAEEVEKVKSEFESKIESATVSNQEIENTIKAKAYEFLQEMSQSENQDDNEDKTNDSPDGSVNGPDEDGSPEQKGSGETPEENEGTKGNGAE